MTSLQSFSTTVVLATAFAATALPVQARPYAGFSGLAAAADSAMTAGNNPAGSTRFDKSAYHVELLAFYSESEWEAELGNTGKRLKSDESSDIVVPAGYGVWPINDRLAASFTILGVGFSDDLGDWPGRWLRKTGNGWPGCRLWPVAVVRG